MPKDLAAFRQFYMQEIRPLPLETPQEKKHRVSINVVMPISLVLFILLILLLPLGNAKFLIIVLFLFGWGFLYRYLLWISHYKRRDAVLEKVLSFFEGDLIYQKEKLDHLGNWVAKFHREEIFIPSLDIELVNMYDSDDGELIYRGTVFSWKHHYPITHPILILKDHSEKRLGSFAHKLQKLHPRLPKLYVTSDLYFERLYQVRCNSIAQCEALFTPELLEKIGAWHNAERSEFSIDAKRLQLRYTTPNLDLESHINSESYREYKSYEPLMNRYLLAHTLHQKMEEIFGPDFFSGGK
jgi:hypothetical protein